MSSSPSPEHPRSKRFLSILGWAIAFVVSMISFFKEFPINKTTIVAVSHYHKLAPGWHTKSAVNQPPPSTPITDSQSCDGILGFDVMNFEDQDCDIKHLDISNMGAVITDVYSSGDTSNPTEERLHYMLRAKLENKEAKIDELNLETEHGEFEIKGVGLRKGGGLHLDFFLNKKQCPQEIGKDKYNDTIGKISLEMEKDSDKVNFVSVPLTQLIRDRYDSEKKEGKVIAYTSLISAILIVSAFSYMLWRKGY